MFLICGEALFDLFPAGPPGAMTFAARHGGSPYNVAIGLARLAAPVGFFSGVSADFLGRLIMKNLAAEQVDTSYLAVKDAPTTLSLVMLDEQGVPAYAFYGTGAADRVLAPADLPQLRDDVTGLHFGSYSLVCEPAAGTYLRLAAAQAGQRLISLDPNVRLNVAPDTGLWRSRVAEWAALADVIKVSAEDLHLLYPGAAVETLAQGWLGGGTALVVVTQGAAGATAFTAAARIDVAAPAVELVDTVGAGDAFQAALLYQLWRRGCRANAAIRALHEDALREILEFATKAGAFACTRQGADLPRLSDLRPQSPSGKHGER